MFKYLSNKFLLILNIHIECPHLDQTSKSSLSQDCNVLTELHLDASQLQLGQYLLVTRSLVFSGTTSSMAICSQLLALLSKTVSRSFICSPIFLTYLVIIQLKNCFVIHSSECVKFAVNGSYSGKRLKACQSLSMCLK